MESIVKQHATVTNKNPAEQLFMATPFDDEV